MDQREIDATGRDKFYKELVDRYGHPCGEDCPCGHYDGHYGYNSEPEGSPYSAAGIFLGLALLSLLGLLVAELGQKLGLWML